MAILTITDINFKTEVMDSNIPVFIDFWAPWCIPCTIVSPIIDDIAENNETFKICKVNIDEFPDIAASFNVMSIPHFSLIRFGEIIAFATGVQPKDILIELLNYNPELESTVENLSEEAIKVNIPDISL